LSDESDANYKESLHKESQVYDILSDLKEKGDIFEGINVNELEKMLQGKYKDRYYDLSLWHYFGEIPTNKDRFKEKNKVIVKNYKVFPRPIMVFIIKKEKIVKIKETFDDGRSWLWSDY
jgi:hypothetical protein